MTRTRTRRLLATVAIAIGASGVVSLTGTDVQAAPRPSGPTSPPTAIVSMGDSFISGEAGRWFGNSNNPLASRNRTDRAYRAKFLGWSYDTNAVYPGGSYQNGCNRSDVAPIRSATIAVSEKINLACSGASSVNIWRASQGGQSYKGEAPQADQLLAVAQQKQVTMIVLSIGGNDLGFADIIVDCALRFTVTPSAAPDRCNDDQQPNVDARMPAAVAGVGKSVDEIRAVMSQAGYTDGQYRIVLTTYPSPIPRGSEIRYSESGYSRLTTGGCPFWNADATWARDSLVPQIADNIRSVAIAKGVDLLDDRNAFQGRENCSVSATQVGSGGPNPASSEWTRWVGTGILQGQIQESVHPNAYGQQAIGRCLTLLYAQPAGGRWSCTNTPGQGPGSMVLTATP